MDNSDDNHDFIWLIPPESFIDKQGEGSFQGPRCGATEHLLKYTNKAK